MISNDFFNLNFLYKIILYTKLNYMNSIINIKDYIQVNKYDVFLDIDIPRIIYKGYVIISINLLQKTNTIFINAVDFVIKSIVIDNYSYHINNYSYHINNKDGIIEITDDIGFKLNSNLLIKIEFDWKKISEEIDGFYYTKKNNNIICVTQLEPESARKFIPCFDQPDLKALFNIMVRINSEFECVSNTSVKKTISDDKYKTIYFNTTPLMSTYLLCIVCGNIKNSQLEQISNEGIIVRGYCIESDLKYINWSVDKTKEALNFFENWFKIKYPIDKLDIVSVPNFSSGAMENWGLITFREEYILLYNKKNYLSQVKILEVIYHEVAHQWFGNLVTMSKWEDLWLNEATATFFSWMALLMTYSNSDLNIKEFYWLFEAKNVYLIDALSNTHPIIISETNHQVNPSELFDEITYSKGNLIINYVANLLGLNNFQKAIQKYLNEYLYSNPPTGDKLFQYFNLYSENKKINYIELMNKLTTTKGYPILSIYKNNNHTLNITYKTFNLDKSIIVDYPINLFLKIKFLNEYQIIQLNYSQLNEYNFNIGLDLDLGLDLDKHLVDNCIINPNNELFCICDYVNYKPNIQLMNQVELMKYASDEFILGLYGYKNLNEYLLLIKDIFNSIDFTNNQILCSTILGDLIHLLNIFNYSKTNNTIIIDFIKNNLDTQLVNLSQKLLSSSSSKYSEFILENIFTLYAIKLEEKNFITIIYKLYLYQNKLVSKIQNYYDKYYLSKTIFSVGMKYYQDVEFDNLICVLKTSSNVQIIDNLISSFSYLNDKNFDFVFNNYSHLIKSQNLPLFFSSITKNVSKQEYVIDYWISNRDKISSIEEIQLKIIKNISKNIYNIQLIEKITNYLNKIYVEKNKLVIDKIIDILTSNKIVITLGIGNN